MTFSGTLSVTATKVRRVFLGRARVEETERSVRRDFSEEASPFEASGLDEPLVFAAALEAVFEDAFGTAFPTVLAAVRGADFAAGAAVSAGAVLDFRAVRMEGREAALALPVLTEEEALPEAEELPLRNSPSPNSSSKFRLDSGVCALVLRVDLDLTVGMNIPPYAVK